MYPYLQRTIIILKRFSLFLSIFLGSVIITGIVLFIIYKDSIKQSILSEINEYLAADIQAGEISISAMAHFPQVSVKLKDLVIRDPKASPGDSILMTTGYLSLQFNLVDLFHKKYTLQSVWVTNARIHLAVYEDGRMNYHFRENAAPDTPGDFSVALRQVTLQNVKIFWQDRRKDHVFSFTAIDGKLKGSINPDQVDLSARCDLMVHGIRTGNTVYLDNREMEISISMKRNTMDQAWQLSHGVIRSGLLTWHITGAIHASGPMETDLHIRSEPAPLEEYLGLVPPYTWSFPGNLEAGGEMATSITLHGMLDGPSIPDIIIRFEVSKGTLRYKTPVVHLTDIMLSGQYRRISSSGHRPKDELQINRILATYGKGKIEGSLKIADFRHPFVHLSADMTMAFADLMDLLPLDTLMEGDGEIAITLNMKGPVSDPGHPDLQDLLTATVQGNMKMHLDRLLLKNGLALFHDVQAELSLNDRHLDIHSLSGKSGKSDFRLQGAVMHFLPWLNDKNTVLRIDANLTGEHLIVDDLLLSPAHQPNGTFRFRIPSGIILSLDVSLGELSYREFRASAVRANLTIREQNMTLHDLTFASMQGTVTADVRLTKEGGGSYRLKSNARLRKVNIRQLFHDLDDFGQKSLTHEHLGGIVDADVYYASLLGSDLRVDPESMYALGQMTVTSGELIGYTPLYRLSDFLKLEELEHIRFSELKNLIEIRHQTIIIPEMEIKSNTLDLNLYGTHTFDNQVDYHLNLLLSQLLSARFKTQPQEEFGVLEDDGRGRTTLFLSVTGNANDPKVSIDRLALREKIMTDLEKERLDIKTSLQNEFRVSEEKALQAEQLRQQEKGSFLIEWSEDSTDKGLTKQQTGKIRGAKFNISWQEEDTLPGRKAP